MLPKMFFLKKTKQIISTPLIFMPVQHVPTVIHCTFNIWLIESDCEKTTPNPNPKTLATASGEIARLTDRCTDRFFFSLTYLESKT